MCSVPAVFISYAREDRASVEPVRQKLKANGFAAWVDVKGLQGGDQWKKEIERNIDAAVALLVAVTPDSVESKWVKFEVQKAIHLGKTVVPLIMRPATLPVFLEDIHAIDLTDNYDHGMDALVSSLVRIIYARAVSARATSETDEGPESTILPTDDDRDFLCVEGPLDCLAKLNHFLRRGRNYRPKEEFIERGEEVVLHRAVSVEFGEAGFKNALGGAYTTNALQMRKLLDEYEVLIAEYVREAYLNDATVYGMLDYNDPRVDRVFDETLALVKRVYLDPAEVDTSLLTVCSNLRGINLYVIGLKNKTKSVRWLGGCLMLCPEHGVPERAYFSTHPNVLTSWADYYREVERRFGKEALGLDHKAFGKFDVQRLRGLYIDYYRRTASTTDNLASASEALRTTADMLGRARDWTVGGDQVVLYRAIVSEFTSKLFQNFYRRRRPEMMKVIEKYQDLIAEYVREEQLVDVSIFGTPFDAEQLQQTLQAIERCYFPVDEESGSEVFVRTTDVGFLPTLQHRSLFILGDRHDSQGDMQPRCGCLIFHDRLGMPEKGVFTSQRATLDVFLALWRQLNEELQDDPRGIQLSGTREYTVTEEEKMEVFRRNIAQKMIDEFNRAHPANPQEFDPQTMIRPRGA